jgi:hypothetical protein
VQVDPIKPTLKAPIIERLKEKYDSLLSNFAFNFNLRRYPAALAGLLDPVENLGNVADPGAEGRAVTVYVSCSCE